jgi:hypothetical protein
MVRQGEIHSDLLSRIASARFFAAFVVFCVQKRALVPH